MRTSFMGSEDDDQSLEEANDVFWDSLLARIRADGFPTPPRTVLDVGSHRGGLLERVIKAWGATRVYGIEPIATLRKRALLRLQAQAPHVEMLDPTAWGQVPSNAVDLLLAFESFHLITDLDGVFDELARVLAPTGRAYVVLGCHAENPVWASWRAQLEAMGHAVASHRPLELMKAGAQRGLLPSVRALRDNGWVTHDPVDPGFSFSSVDEMLNHHFKHKLVFRFVRK